jgi:hypothetical protein
MTQRRTLTPETAAALVGLPVDDLLDLAKEGAVPMSTLSMRGWFFSRQGLIQLADRLALTITDDDGGEAA